MMHNYLPRNNVYYMKQHKRTNYKQLAINMLAVWGAICAVLMLVSAIMN